jgi:hypothetical protein
MMNAAPKQAEKVACGSLMPSSVPATCSQDDSIRLASLRNKPLNVSVSKLQSYKSSVAADEVVHGLRQVQLADGREHAEGVASKEDDVLGVRPDAWYLGVGDVLDRVSGTGVLCDRFIRVVDFAGVLVEDNVLQHCKQSISPECKPVNFFSYIVQGKSREEGGFRQRYLFRT